MILNGRSIAHWSIFNLQINKVNNLSKCNENSNGTCFHLIQENGSELKLGTSIGVTHYTNRQALRHHFMKISNRPWRSRIVRGGLESSVKASNRSRRSRKLKWSTSTGARVIRLIHECVVFMFWNSCAIRSTAVLYLFNWFTVRSTRGHSDW